MRLPLLTHSVFTLLNILPNKKETSIDRTTPPLIPRRIIFGHPDYVQVSLSPDGKWLAWLAPIDNVSNIWVKQMPNGEAKNLTYDTERGIQDISWMYDNRTIVYSQDKDGDENWRLYTLNVLTGTINLATDVEGVAAMILAKSLRYPNRIIIGLNNRNPSYHDAYNLDLKTGNKTLIFLNDYFGGYVIDDELKIRLVYNETDEGGMNYYTFENGTVTLYKTVPFGDLDNVGPLDFDETGENLYWIDSTDNEDLGSLYIENLNSKDKRIVYKTTKAAITSVTLHPITNKPIYLTVEYAKPKRVMLDKKYTKDFEFVRRFMPNKANPWIVSYSVDFNIWIVVPETDTGPEQYFYYDRNNADRSVNFIFYSQKSLLNYTFAPMRSVEIPISDGFKELCYLTLPVESDPSNTGYPLELLPTILFVHGGPWARDSWGFDPAVQYLANRGYAILQCNYRSSTGFGKKILNAGNGEWGKKMQQDLTDAVNWAIKNKIADPKRVAILGGSYGGYATLAGLTFTSDLYACGVDIVGPSNLVTLLKSVPMYWRPQLNIMIKRIGGDPETKEGRKFLENISPLFFARKIKKPLLIGQGGNDPRVNKNESDQIVEEMQKAKIPVTYLLFPDEGHGFVRPENNIAFFAVAEQFFSKCLGGRAEPLQDEISESSMQIKSSSIANLTIST